MLCHLFLHGSAPSFDPNKYRQTAVMAALSVSLYQTALRVPGLATPAACKSSKRLLPAAAFGLRPRRCFPVEFCSVVAAPAKRSSSARRAFSPKRRASTSAIGSKTALFRRYCTVPTSPVVLGDACLDLLSQIKRALKNQRSLSLSGNKNLGRSFMEFAYRNNSSRATCDCMFPVPDANLSCPTAIAAFSF